MMMKGFLVGLLVILLPSSSLAIFPKDSSTTSATFFRHVTEGLTHEDRILVDKNVTSHPQDLELSPPDFVSVYACIDDSKKKKRNSRAFLQRLGQQARALIDRDLGTHGAVLFRNLPCRTAKEFSTFWKACGYKETWYASSYGVRPKLDGVDLAANIPSAWPLPCHNELVYNPRPCSRIAFYCLQPAAQGGESLLVRNREFTSAIPKEIIDFVKAKGGVIYVRRYLDETAPGERPPNTRTWQERCGCTERSEVIQYFQGLGFEDISFDDAGTVTVRYPHSGFLQGDDDDDDKESGHSNRKIWFNSIAPKFQKACLLGDGTEFSKASKAMADELTRKKWEISRALKLQQGDWLVLNNYRVQHGRLPFQDSDDQKRTLLTVYTE